MWVASRRKGARLQRVFFPSEAGGKAFPGLHGEKVFQPDCAQFTCKAYGTDNPQLVLLKIQATSTD